MATHFRAHPGPESRNCDFSQTLLGPEGIRDRIWFDAGFPGNWATACFASLASFASLLPAVVRSCAPNPTPIFLRNAVGGSPPAKIHTKSLGISCSLPFTSRTTESFLTSTVLVLMNTLTLHLRMVSSFLLAF